MKLISVKRNEVKYFINENERLVLLDRLKAALDEDRHNRDEGYYIRSLYFDTIDDKAFHEKTSGVEERQKYRLRIYDLETKDVKLEIKNKFNQQIRKDTLTITREEAERLEKGDCEFLIENQDPVSRKIYATFKTQRMTPVVLVDYNRMAFKHSLNNIRITIDMGLRKNDVNPYLFKEKQIMKKIFPENMHILEVKFNNFIPKWITNIVEPHYFTKSAISKYTLSRLY